MPVITALTRPLLAALLIALLSALLAPAALAAPRPAANAGEIDGQLADGTTGGTPIAGQTVSLLAGIGLGQRTVGSAVTDAQGHFRFTGLATDPSSVYAATTTYQGAPYTTDPLSLATNSRLAVTLLAYEATASNARIGITRIVIDVGAPHTLEGTIPVSELVTVVNATQRTYVGSTTPANGKPMNLARFGLPAGATNLTTGQGFDSGQTIQVNGGFATTAPVYPGQTEFQFSFEYPYDGTRSALTYQAFYPTVAVVVLAPSGVSLTSKELGAQQVVPLPGGGQEHVLQGGPFPAGFGAAIQLASLPVPGERSDFDPRLLYALAGGLALLAFGLAAYALRRGGSPLGAALRVPRATDARVARPNVGGDMGRARVPAGARAVADGAAAASGLLKALAELDHAHDGGAVADEAYRVQRAALKARLKAVMLAEGEATPAGTQAGGGRP